ncbi:N-formyl-4-amino-5-aminomethyl-2-methylpyrimidine deformylase [archaeon HR01]|nr:N-formyl-4-amino-5-aminomethyl-2-methylpyrimidine deformylase [archaeon HR01]
MERGLLFNQIRQNGDRYLKLVETLISQPSVSATGEGLRDCARLVEGLLEDVGLRVTSYEVGGGGPIILGELNVEAHATLMFYNHYDVQPADPLDRWSSNPFQPTIKDGKIFGRGAADNKGNIAARIAAIDTLLSLLGELPVNIKFLVEGGEEIGSPGLERFVNEHSDILFADGCIWEYGHVSRRGPPVINLGVKGMLYVEVEATGVEYHSSLGGIVENPGWRLVEFLKMVHGVDGRVLVDGFYEDVEEVSDELLEMLDVVRLSDVTPEGISTGPGNVDEKKLLKRLLLEPACNICGLSAGYTGEGAKTSIPSRAVAKLDFRLVPKQDPDKIFQRIESLAAGAGVRIRKIHGYPAARTQPDSYLVHLVADTAREAYGSEPVVLPSGAASGPMYLFTDVLGMPCVSTGVGYAGSNVHGPNENIRIEDFYKGIAHIALIMRYFHSYLR